MDFSFEEYIANHYKWINSDSPIKLDFYDALIVFLNNNIIVQDSEGKYYTLFCSIHDHFLEGHNCVACNLNENNQRIENFLLNFFFLNKKTFSY